MVVSDSYRIMLSNTTNENHYIIPDPTVNSSLDSKSSPLAMLAQACSQIGADTSNAKSLHSAVDRAAAISSSKKPPSSTGSNSSSNDRSSSTNGHRQPSPTHSQPPPSSTPLYKSHHSSAGNVTTAHERKSPDSKLAFKPYELNVLTSTRKTDRPSSGHPTEDHDRKPSNNSSRASSRKSASASPPSHQYHQSHHHSNTVSPQRDPTAKLSTSPATATAATDSCTKPQTPLEASTPTPSKSSAAEALYLKESAAAASFKSPYSLSPLANYSGCNGCPTTLPPGFDPTNPAFRNAFANGAAAAHLTHPALLDAAACFQASSPNPYLGYTRVKTPTGSEAVMPVCKDPYCLSCRFTTTLHGVGPCPPGCVQCEPKYNTAAAAAMLMNPFASYQYGRPYVCNWVGGGNEYCGKRFRNSDELLAHLRSHSSTSDAIALMNHMRYPAAAAAAAASSLGPLSAAAAAAAAARYHPYSKPGAHPASLAASPFSAFNPALAPFYPPYPLYDQRIGAAVNP